MFHTSPASNILIPDSVKTHPIDQAIPNKATKITQTFCQKLLSDFADFQCKTLKDWIAPCL